MPKTAGVGGLLEALFKSIQKNDLEKLNDNLICMNNFTGASLISSQAKANGDYLVTAAARHGRLNILKHLREVFNACLEVDNNDGKRPIHEAAQHGHADCVAYLIGQNVSVDALKRADWTALMLACTKDDLSVIRILVEEGKALYKDLKNKDGWTAFHIACREGHEDVIRYFLDLDTSLWLTESAVSRTPLHTAVLHGRTETVKILLEHVSIGGINARDRCGVTPFLDAIKGGHLKIVEMLIESHSKTSIEDTLLLDCDAIGRLPLDFAAMFGDSEIFRVVLNATAEALETKSGRSEQTKERYVPSENHQCSDYFVKEALLRRNKHFARTPLHYAALEGHLFVIQIIVDKLLKKVDEEENRRLKLNVDEILVTDGDGKSPIDLARIGKHSGCVELLSNLSARHDLQLHVFI